MRKYVKNHGIIFGGPQNFVGFSTGPWTGKGWETLRYSIPAYTGPFRALIVVIKQNNTELTSK
jgi:hypothetical protein